jgi:hypothetical protein
MPNIVLQIEIIFKRDTVCVSTQRPQILGRSVGNILKTF